jgi:predicted methyltransferase
MSRKKTSAQLEAEIAKSLAKGHRQATRRARTKKAAPRIAYRLQLTPSELRAVEFARGRYAWPDMLAAHAAENGAIAFTESEMWQWTDDVDSDAEGGHSPFPLASSAFAEKLQSFYDERV